MFTPRAFALQGVGFSALALALQGLLYGGTTAPTPPTTGIGVSRSWYYDRPTKVVDPEEDEALILARAI